MYTPNSTSRAALPSSSSNPVTPATPSPANASTAAMSVADLQRCSVPPQHDNPHVDYATANDQIRDWLFNGTRPQSAAEVTAIAVFCVKQKLPDALSWLVLQCGLKNLDLGAARLDVQDVQMIVSWLDCCPGGIELTSLNVADIDETGATAIADALKANSPLPSPNIEDNNIGDTGDTGATALADGLRTNRTLTSLNIAGSGPA